ncbi:MAG: HDIG domain-containing protein [Anaerolineales bacterium]|nr:HDIG domain-containing protein [Anaerolineales bacterium]
MFSAWNAARLGVIFLLALVGATAALSLPINQRTAGVVLQAGQVASQDVQAPFALTFSSETRTEEARRIASDGVEPVFDPPDSRVAREQVQRLRSTLDYVDSVRADEFASPEQKVADLSALSDIRIPAERAQAILQLADARWQAVRLEALAVLEQVMRAEIREGSIEGARRAVPALVSISLPESQAELVADLAAAFVAPNALYNEPLTREAQDAARQRVEPVARTFASSETIVARGQVVQPIDIEALQAYGLIRPPNPGREIALRGLLVTLLGCTIGLYLYRVHRKQIASARLAVVTGLAFVLTAITLQAMIPGHAVLPYIFHAAALPMVLTVLLSPGMGILAALATGAVAGYLAPRGLEVGLYVALSGCIASLVIGRAERISAFLWAGLAGSVGAIAVVVLFRFADPTTDLVGKTTLLVAGLMTGLLSASLAFGFVLLAGTLLGGTSNLQLIELSRPDHPLLQLILRNAPGTYQHSLQVANLAEQAARAVGANALLVRVGALYHDAGKALRPQFFIENQMPGQNIHEQLDPTTSASLIVSHVTDGLELARKHRLPSRIAAFIPEHHGTLEATYQLQAALEAAGGEPERVNRRDFVYPGPRPRTRESAILMLADGVEAKARADAPETEEEIEDLVRWVVEDRLSKGQLDRTELTFRDLDNIRRSFVSSLRSMYHSRLRYPEANGNGNRPAKSEEAAVSER